MVRHIILWKLKSSFSPEEKQKKALEIKTGLEGLKGKIPGLTEIEVIITPLESSNADVMLLSSFTDEESLKGYQAHPEHLAVANHIVRPATESRSCMDYLE